MAVEVLENDSDMTHEARHDLESFFWLLVWLVLRHTKHQVTKKYKDAPWHKLFDSTEMHVCQSNKHSWLTYPLRPLTVTNNEPLTTLLERFRVLCRKNYDNIGLKEAWMTHQDVLQLFNEALADRSKWPQADQAIPWALPATRPGSIMGEVGSGQPRMKGTLSFTQSISGDISGSPFGEGAAPSCIQPDEDSTGSESEVDMQDLPGQAENALGKGKAPARQIAPSGRGVTRGQGIRQASATPSYASGSHESPPSSNPTSESNGSEAAQHPSGHALRSSKKSTEKLRKTTRSNARSMGPPPVPRNRSGTSRSQSSSRPAIAGPSQHNTRAAKRSRTREDEAEEEAAGTSHSPKRPRTAGQRSVERAKESSKAKGKKRAS